MNGCCFWRATKGICSPPTRRTKPSHLTRNTFGARGGTRARAARPTRIPTKLMIAAATTTTKKKTNNNNKQTTNKQQINNAQATNNQQTTNNNQQQPTTTNHNQPSNKQTKQQQQIQIQIQMQIHMQNSQLRVCAQVHYRLCVAQQYSQIYRDQMYFREERAGNKKCLCIMSFHFSSFHTFPRFHWFARLTSSTLFHFI